MISPAVSIVTYIRAKDGNRPHLLDTAFSEDAVLQMLVRTESISFPASCVGREAIAETLVRRFNQTYENVYTWCIGAPPVPNAEGFSCDWLVAMSEKQGGAVRIGCGRYDWSFSRPDHRVRSLAITIEAMETLPRETLAPVMKWASNLPYPWCSRELVTGTPPHLPGVPHVLELLRLEVA
jgi:hypothetical protein